MVKYIKFPHLLHYKHNLHLLLTQIDEYEMFYPKESFIFTKDDIINQIVNIDLNKYYIIKPTNVDRQEGIKVIFYQNKEKIVNIIQNHIKDFPKSDKWLFQPFIESYLVKIDNDKMVEK